MSVDSCVLPGVLGASLGDPLLDRYVVFVAGRVRPNTVLATVSDLRLFFSVVRKDPREVTASDVLDFITEQRRPRGDGRVVRLSDGQGGLSSQTIKRRLSSVSGLYSWLLILGEVRANPVPRGLSTRRPRGQQQAMVPLVRSPRTLPRVLDPAEVDALISALRRWRDRAMVEAMVLGGLRRCEVLGLRAQDLRPGEGRVFIADGKGGHARIANRTVAEQFNAVSDRVDALYADPDLPGTETPAMRRLRTEHRRMLGNGWCTRPTNLDCSFETICEGCGFFQTTIEFRPTLQAQHDHAAAHDQTSRAELYQHLLDDTA